MVVARNSKQKDLSLHLLPIEDDFKWSTVRLAEVFERRLRLEASVFGVDGKHAREVLKNCKWKITELWSKSGLVEDVYYPGRFKRIYVDKNNGLPFYLPSQINEIYPKPSKFISPLTDVPWDQLKIQRNTILLTRSGTIGNCSIVSKTLEGKIFSDDVIRFKGITEEDSGYVYAFLKTTIGQTLMRTNNYGSVVQHIEPEHLSQLPIPDPDSLIKLDIHKLVMDSFRLRDESNDLIDQAEQILLKELQLPSIDQLKPKYLEKEHYLHCFSAKASQLSGRFESTYHEPIVEEIIKHLSKYAEEVTSLGDSRISKQIILPGRFKRIYVEEGQGVVFFGGKELLELDPSNDKFLSLTHHANRIRKQLSLQENMVMITCSGTLGKINIVPKHWENWTANQHIIRIIPVDSSIAGYIYTWLNSDYGYELIHRFSYGSVVDEIDNYHVAQIRIPLLKNIAQQQRINALVLQGNEKRFEAYQKEQEAIKMVNEMVLYAK